MFLNFEQIKMVLHLGDAEDGSTGAAIIDKDVFVSLFDLGLVHERPDGRFDLTDEGEELYSQLDQRRESLPP